MDENQLLKRIFLKINWLFGLLAVFLVFCFIYLRSLDFVSDPDIWLHIRTGEFIFKNHLIPFTDIFSFTLADKPWVDHSWLFQLCAYFSFSSLGVDGLIYLQALGIMLSFSVLFFIAYKLVGSYLESALLIFLASSAGYSRFNIRPEIFSFLFFCVFLCFLEFYPKRKIIWLLLPLQIVWVNIHGYFFLGPVLIFLYLAADFLNRKISFLRLNWQGQELYDQPTLRRLKVVFLAAILLTLVNPYGISGAIYPLRVFSEILFGQAQSSFNYIIELKSVFALKINSLKFYYFMGGLYLAAMFLNIRRLRPKDLFLGLFFLFFGLIARNVLFFIAISTVGIAYHLGLILRDFKDQSLQKQFPKLIFHLLVLRYVLALCVLILVAKDIKNQYHKFVFDFKMQKFQYRFFGLDAESYPVGAVDFVLANNLPKLMFNDFNSGAYLIGRGYPLRKVFVDGRSEFYGQDFMNQYFKAMNGDADVIEAILKKYDLQAALLTMVVIPAPKIAGYFYHHPDWKLIFFDDMGVIFLKNVKANQALIKKYQVDLKKYKVIPADLKKIGLKYIYPGPYVRRIFFFDIFGLDDLEEQEAKEALRIFPNCWQARWCLGRVYLRQKRYQQAWESLRWAYILSDHDFKVWEDLKEVKKYFK